MIWCEGRREGGELKDIHGGGMKRRRRQLQERKKHTRQCVKTVEENKRMYKSMKNKLNKAVFLKQGDSRLKRCLLNYKIAQMGCLDK